MNVTASLFQWLKTFNLTTNPVTIQDLSDGVAIAQALTQISPEYFDRNWLDKIKLDVGNNWRLRLSNLNKIKQKICDFYSDVLYHNLNDKFIPDVNAIAKDSKLDQLTLLLQLILGCAINCDKKNEFIVAILNLNQDVQQDLMSAIQELKEVVEESSEYPPEQRDSDLSKKLEEVLRERDVIFQKCHELETRNTKLQEEKISLMKEIERKENAERSIQSFSFQEDAFQRLQNKIDSLQNDLFKMEEAKEEYRISAEKLQEEISNLRSSNEHLKHKIPEYQHMKDELESLRYLYEEFEKVKRINENQRKKIEEFQDNRRQLRLEEEKSASLMRRNMELEGEIKKMSALKSQMDNYKQQINDLRMKLSEEKCRTDKLNYDFSKINEKYVIVCQEKDKFAHELAILKAKLTPREFDRTPSLEEEGPMHMQDEFSQVRLSHKNRQSNLDGIKLDIEDQIKRIGFENEILKQKVADSENEKLKVVELQLQDEKDRVLDLENKNRSLNQKVIELEDKIKDMQSNVFKNKPQTVEGKSLDQLSAMEEIIRHKDSVIESIKNELHDYELEISTLKSTLAKREEELTETENRYKKHVEKAKVVLGTLEPISIPSLEDPNQLKLLLQQKEEQIIQLKNEFEKLNSLKEMEQRLMTIAFHNLSANLQRKSADERMRCTSVGSNSGSASFLSRQRQATTRRYNTSGVSPRLWSQQF